jgi:PAS domain-containing protein
MAEQQWSEAGMVAGADRERPVLSLFERTLDNLPDGVMLVGADHSVLYTNKVFERLWGLPPQMLAQWQHIVEHIARQMDDPAKFMQQVVRLYGTGEYSEDELHLRDGRTISRRECSLQLRRRRLRPNLDIY